MRETIMFFDMFSDYEPPEDMYSCLAQAAIVSAGVDPAARMVDVTV